MYRYIEIIIYFYSENKKLIFNYSKFKSKFNLTL